jgi:hypothetical protein
VSPSGSRESASNPHTSSHGHSGAERTRPPLSVRISKQVGNCSAKSPQRLTFTSIDRLVFAGLYRLAPGVLDALKVVRPETVIRWHRAGFRAYWRWKSRRRSGRPTTPLEIRQLIREISPANPLWGAPRIHGELLKLGIDVGQTTVASMWRGEGDRRPQGGRRSLIITPTASRRWTCSWFRHSHSDCSTGC